ncbi:shikimate/quinate 5-dehydrogenase [Aspergillus vadensis CBS 113365]|uniref:Shikimate/quinate 5-dehydrogenase n=1 Tax=Aspergillus vadensis (strain CBS 113365 / IMI 142717 / IBT 24658) TaxID=1448311 RepID=A0A319AXI9_ASPVC|nr:shikimate/quinate 5-dehydrogenase [Aspergillus vadensis CBS 113365]PYH65096.1 shikimate/quinate 5-dehydrogenase [Aspergillus vadensis CBS 113365]
MHHLPNPTIQTLLLNLTRPEIHHFLHIISSTLISFSTTPERQHQPPPSTITRPNGQRTLFRPFTSPDSIGAKLVVEPAPNSTTGKREHPIQGLLIILDPLGNPTGILSAEEITGYRTSMSAMIPFSWRKHVSNIVIFGAGMQALWHTRLILGLRGEEVRCTTFVGSSRGRVEELVGRVREEMGGRWGSEGCKFAFVSAGSDGEVERSLREADCVFCTTPSQKMLFPAAWVMEKGEAGRRRPLVSAIGSWLPEMIELDPELLRRVVSGEEGFNPLTGEWGRGVVLVDDREYAMHGCGEVVQSGLEEEDVVEIGELLALKSGRIQVSGDEHVRRVERFMEEGLVAYKSVGVGLTDLTAGREVLRLYQEKQGSL